MKWARRILLLAIVVALPIGSYQFVSRNEQTIAIDYLAGRLEGVEIWAAVGACFGVGFLLGWLFALLLGARRTLEARRYRKAVRSLEAEVHQLRNLPLSPDEESAAATSHETEPGLAPEPLTQAAGLERGT
ncbi:MAG: lipopolysaccharide assembly protein LapA domain-containing protein [Myxococcota bacterium]|nr:lipopolysaccharide assembly protein LapA domain-containing protein [Myxococcota bacterium]